MFVSRGPFCFVALIAVASSVTHAFVPLVSPPKTFQQKQQQQQQQPLAQAADAWTGNSGASGAASSGGSSSGSSFGSLEQIEFKIYPDGRVEETVRGVKGNNCHKVTESINEKLGQVIASRPTEEMFEQEVKVTQTLYQTDASGDWDGSSSW